MKHRKKIKVSSVFVFLAMFIMTMTFLFPLWFMVINSFKTKIEYYKGQFALPQALNFDNFRSIIVDFDIFTYFKSSMIVSIASTLLIVFFSVFASYAFSKLRFKGKGIVYFCILATMFIPSQVSMVPAYVMFSKFGLINNYLSVILSYVAGGIPSAILLMNGTFMGISNEMLESAKIDGAGYFSIVRNVIFPMGISAVAIVIIFNFINYWNDLLTPMLFLSASDKQTVMVALTGLVQKTAALPTYQMAGLFISVLPAIVIYLFLQKFLVKGLTMGSFR